MMKKLSTHSALPLQRHTGESQYLAQALNQANPTLALQTAVCFQFGDTVPEWVPLIPVGDVIGRDGRTWTNPTPEKVIERTKASQRQQPLDWEHSTQLKAPKGEQAPAAAWFDDYRVENGHIEGHLVWNAEGRASVEAKQVRYLSPVFRYTESGEVWDISSAGLTNVPNLYLPALNQQQFTQPPQESDMTLDEYLKLVRLKLQLADNASAEEALNRMDSLNSELQTALNRANTPPLTQFVPRADYDAALQRATNAEQQIADKAAADATAQIEQLVDDAIKQGKVTPASKAYYVGACRQENGIEQFKQFVQSAPVITADAGLDGKTPAQNSTALNAEMQHMAQFFGNSEDDLKKFGGLK